MKLKQKIVFSMLDLLFNLWNYMKPEELQKLLKLTALELSDDQKIEFLDYFSSMKVMFDDFISFPLPEWEIDSLDDEPINCFVDQKDFDGLDIIETNVHPSRQVNHAIEICSVIGEE